MRGGEDECSSTVIHDPPNLLPKKKEKERLPQYLKIASPRPSPPRKRSVKEWRERKKDVSTTNKHKIQIHILLISNTIPPPPIRSSELRREGHAKPFHFRKFQYEDRGFATIPLIPFPSPRINPFSCLIRMDCRYVCYWGRSGIALYIHDVAR